MHTVNFRRTEKPTPEQQKDRRLRENLANHFADFVLGKVKMLIPAETSALMRGDEIATPIQKKIYSRYNAGLSYAELFGLIQVCYKSFDGCNTDFGSIISAAKAACVKPNRIYAYQCPICGGQAKAYIDGADGSVHPGCDCYMSFVDAGLPWGWSD